MISKYNSFIEDRIFESAVNESFIYYVDEFKDALVKLRKNAIAKDLLDQEGKDVKPDITFVGMSDKEGYFTFTQMNKAINVVKKSVQERELDSDAFEHIYKNIENGSISKSTIEILYNNKTWDLKGKARTEARISKLVNQLFPGKYTEKQVEEFTNLFKKVGEEELLEMVEGKDIVYWYDVNNYIEETGDLGNSCMRKSKCGSYLKIYTENPEVCRMVILRSADGAKIKGRALVWKVEIPIEGVEYYMDRIYAIDDATKLMFQKYADDKGWLKRLNSTYSDTKDFKLGSVEHKGVRATVQLKKWKFDQYPYADTFKRLNIETGLLINDDNEDREGFYILTNTDGTYTDTSGKWSNWFDCRIPEQEAIWSEPLDDWIWKSDSVEVTIGSRRNRGWYPSEHDDIVEDVVRRENMHSNDAVWCGHYSGYILEDDATEAITYINANECDNEEFDHSIDTVSDREALISIEDMECAKYLKDRVDYGVQILERILGYNGDTQTFYLGDYVIDTYNTAKGYLTEEDMKILDITNKGAKRRTDKIAYVFNMSESTRKELIETLKSKIIELDNIVSGKQTRLEFDYEPGFLDDKTYIIAKSNQIKKYKMRLKYITKWF